MMTKLKLLTARFGPFWCRSHRHPCSHKSVRYTSTGPRRQTNDNSGWNGYNNGGYNNTWYDGKKYRFRSHAGLEKTSPATRPASLADAR